MTIESDRGQHQADCVYYPVLFQDDFSVHIDKGQAVRAGVNVSVASDFVQVKCANYSMVHATIVRPAAVGQSVHMQAGLGVNVVIWGFDSMSRLSWLRALPHTVAMLRQLGGVVLEGYNIVGDGTPQNLLPLLTGRAELELAEMRRHMPGASTMDDLPWLWRDYQHAGYVTQWGEDGAKYGTFQYRFLGFKQPPVDHYMRPFFLATEPLYSQHAPYCLGSTPRHVIMMHYLTDLYLSYPYQPKFSFIFHSEMSHDDHVLLSQADGDLVSTLQALPLHDTVVILLSDHGSRFAHMRASVQGKYEERLPFLGVLLPLRIVQQYPWLQSNLQANVDKLTTPFDVHETLLDLLDLGRLQDKSETSGRRGLSLFSLIPGQRSCAQAGIAPHWCSCLHWQVCPCLHNFTLHLHCNY